MRAIFPRFFTLLSVHFSLYGVSSFYTRNFVCLILPHGQLPASPRSDRADCQLCRPRQIFACLAVPFSTVDRRRKGKGLGERNADRAWLCPPARPLPGDHSV